jgi:hypothetical protein
VITEERETLDRSIERVLLTTTIGEVIAGAERSPRFRDFFICRLIMDATEGQDIRVIKQLIARLDGAAPKDTEMEHYQTRLADVLEEILDYTDNKQLSIDPLDSPLMAIGKTIAYIALKPAKKGSTESKNCKDAAVGIILDRCGGRRTTPLKGDLVIEYEEPDWLTESPQQIAEGPAGKEEPQLAME